MSNGPPSWHELPSDAAELAQQLHNDTPLDEVFNSLRIYLCYCAPNLDVVAPVLLPLIEAALDRVDVGQEDELPDSDELIAIFSRLGPAVICLARSPHPEIREAVAAGLAKMGPAADAAADGIAGLLTDPEPGVRAQACKALAAVRPTRDTARLLIERLEDTSEDVLGEAILGLGRMGPVAAEAVVPLVRFLDPNHRDTRPVLYPVLRALTNLPVDARLLPHLQPLLKRDWKKLCSESLQPRLEVDVLAVVLARLGPAARDCVPDLEPLLLFDEESLYAGTKSTIACALLQIDPNNEQARQALERFATSADATIRRIAIEDMAEELPIALLAQFRPLLEQLAKDSDEEVRTSAEVILSQISNG